VPGQEVDRTSLPELRVGDLWQDLPTEAREPLDNAFTEPSGGLVISVDRNSETLRSIGLDLGQRVDFTIDTVVEIGESIYVVVDSGTDAICDLTSLRLTIVEK